MMPCPRTSFTSKIKLYNLCFRPIEWDGANPLVKSNLSTYMCLIHYPKHGIITKPYKRPRINMPITFQ